MRHILCCPGLCRVVFANMLCLCSCVRVHVRGGALRCGVLLPGTMSVCAVLSTSGEYAKTFVMFETGFLVPPRGAIADR